MKIKKILTMALATALALGITSNTLVPNTVYAKESAETVSNEFLDDHKAVGTIDTADIVTFSLDESQMTEKQQNNYRQALSGEWYELGVGESVVIDSDDEGVISITCISSETSLARASWETSYKTYNITKTYQGVETVLVTVDLECEWYKNGIDGFIKNLKGTYHVKNNAWSCSWDNDNVQALPYNHALWLDLYSAGKSYSIMFAAGYNPFNETLTFAIES